MAQTVRPAPTRPHVPSLRATTLQAEVDIIGEPQRSFPAPNGPAPNGIAKGLDGHPGLPDQSVPPRNIAACPCTARYGEGCLPSLSAAVRLLRVAHGETTLRPRRGRDHAGGSPRRPNLASRSCRLGAVIQRSSALGPSRPPTVRLRRCPIAGHLTARRELNAPRLVRHSGSRPCRPAGHVAARRSSRCPVGSPPAPRRARDGLCLADVNARKTWASTGSPSEHEVARNPKYRLPVRPQPGPRVTALRPVRVSSANGAVYGSYSMHVAGLGPRPLCNAAGVPENLHATLAAVPGTRPWLPCTRLRPSGSMPCPKPWTACDPVEIDAIIIIGRPKPVSQGAAVGVGEVARVGSLPLAIRSGGLQPSTGTIQGRSVPGRGAWSVQQGAGLAQTGSARVVFAFAAADVRPIPARRSRPHGFRFSRT